jgi:hypothetical protein
MAETQLSTRRLPLHLELKGYMEAQNTVLRGSTLLAEILLLLYERFEGSKSRYGMSSPMKSNYKNPRRSSS